MERHADSMQPENSYPGRILVRPYSRALKARVAALIKACRLFDLTGAPAIPYIAAWRDHAEIILCDTAEEMAGRFSFTVETADDFTPDNTIELQLPFVKHFFPDARIVPVGVPPNAEAPAMGRAAVEISNRLGRRIRIVGSTDLTHYGPNYGFSPKGTGSAAVSWVKEENDRRIIDAILSLSPDQVIEEALSHQNACCAGAAAAAIAAGTALGADAAELVAYATSYDKHPGDSLVGYAGVVF